MKDLVREYHKHYIYHDMTSCTTYITKYTKYIKLFYYNWRMIDDSFYGKYIYNPKKYRNDISFIEVAEIPKKYCKN